MARLRYTVTANDDLVSLTTTVRIAAAVDLSPSDSPIVSGASVATLLVLRSCSGGHGRSCTPTFAD
jgi:hypothetical protein